MTTLYSASDETCDSQRELPVVHLEFLVVHKEFHKSLMKSF